MHDSPELPIKHDRSPDELAELMNQATKEFKDNLPLEVLYRWKDPTYLSKEMREEYPVPEEWIEFNESPTINLTIDEKIKIIKVIGFAARSGIKTVGALRKIKEEELSQRELPVARVAKVTIGPDAAHILSKGFAVSKEQQEESKG